MVNGSSKRGTPPPQGGRVCGVCGHQLAKRKRNKTAPDLCRIHAPTDPDRRASVSAGITAKHADPAWSAARAASLRAARARMEREGHPVIEVWRTNLRRNRINPSVAGSEERRVAVAKAVSTRLAHIPLEYRDEYRHMTVRKKMTAAEASRAVLEQQARDTAHFIATGEMRNMKRKADR